MQPRAGQTPSSSWKTSSISIKSTGLGGVFELSVLARRDGFIAFRVSDDKILKKEAGGHRFQRIPPTEKKGRIQTSTITVAVLPDTKKYEIELDWRDIDVKTYRGSGPGGQHRNKTDSAVRLTHRPTGAVACSEQERSQHRNKEIALERLKSQILSKQKNADKTRRVINRKEQVGSGMRGDKRRTLRTKDDQVVDHITGKKMKASKYMKGFIEKLA